MKNKFEKKICVIGLGYVGLPLAVEFGNKFEVVGFDTNSSRIEMLQSFIDNTMECDSQAIAQSKGLSFTNDAADIAECNFYIITVPTPIDKHNDPDLRPLFNASELVGRNLKHGDIVVYESTVYPGCTEEYCVPILEKKSKLKYNIDFFCGYSPERINPGDKVNTLTNIMKVTSGSTNEIAKVVDGVYRTIIAAGTYQAESIKIAEAAKVIENTQRDLNIALMNELSMLFSMMKIDTKSVLDAASTKWNFLKFKPGLVGGHCIGVDPYYLTYKAKEVGYIPEIILAGRRINDSVGKYIANELIKMMIRRKFNTSHSKILLMGLTFKENCQDLRNSKVVDIYNELIEYGLHVDVYDPHACEIEAMNQYGIQILKHLEPNSYNAIVCAVAHDEFVRMPIAEVRSLCKPNGIFFDIKSIFAINESDWRM